jgi:hypothetical protein
MAKKMMDILPRRLAEVFRSELNRLAELSDIFTHHLKESKYQLGLSSLNKMRRRY